MKTLRLSQSYADDQWALWIALEKAGFDCTYNGQKPVHEPIEETVNPQTGELILTQREEGDPPPPPKPPKVEVTTTTVPKPARKRKAKKLGLLELSIPGPAEPAPRRRLIRQASPHQSSAGSA
jgi:hypothetical protein